MDRVRLRPAFAKQVPVQIADFIVGLPQQNGLVRTQLQQLFCIVPLELAWKRGDRHAQAAALSRYHARGTANLDAH